MESCPHPVVFPYLQVMVDVLKVVPKSFTHVASIYFANIPDMELTRLHAAGFPAVYAQQSSDNPHYFANTMRNILLIAILRADVKRAVSAISAISAHMGAKIAMQELITTCLLLKPMGTVVVTLMASLLVLHKAIHATPGSKTLHAKALRVAVYLACNFGLNTREAVVEVAGMMRCEPHSIPSSLEDVHRTQSYEWAKKMMDAAGSGGSSARIFISVLQKMCTGDEAYALHSVESFTAIKIPSAIKPVSEGDGWVERYKKEAFRLVEDLHSTEATDASAIRLIASRLAARRILKKGGTKTYVPQRRATDAPDMTSEDVLRKRIEEAVEHARRLSEATMREGVVDEMANEKLLSVLPSEDVEGYATKEEFLKKRTVGGSAKTVEECTTFVPPESPDETSPLIPSGALLRTTTEIIFALQLMMKQSALAREDACVAFRRLMFWLVCALCNPLRKNAVTWVPERLRGSFTDQQCRIFAMDVKEATSVACRTIQRMNDLQCSQSSVHQLEAMMRRHADMTDDVEEVAKSEPSHESHFTKWSSMVAQMLGKGFPGQQSGHPYALLWTFILSMFREKHTELTHALLLVEMDNAGLISEEMRVISMFSVLANTWTGGEAPSTTAFDPTPGLEKTLHTLGDAITESNRHHIRDIVGDAYEMCFPSGVCPEAEADARIEVIAMQAVDSEETTRRLRTLAADRHTPAALRNATVSGVWRADPVMVVGALGTPLVENEPTRMSDIAITGHMLVNATLACAHACCDAGQAIEVCKGGSLRGVLRTWSRWVLYTKPQYPRAPCFARKFGVMSEGCGPAFIAITQSIPPHLMNTVSKSLPIINRAPKLVKNMKRRAKQSNFMRKKHKIESVSALADRGALKARHPFERAALGALMMATREVAHDKVVELNVKGMRRTYVLEREHGLYVKDAMKDDDPMRLVRYMLLSRMGYARPEIKCAGGLRLVAAFPQMVAQNAVDMHMNNAMLPLTGTQPSVITVLLDSWTDVDVVYWIVLAAACMPQTTLSTLIRKNMLCSTFICLVYDEMAMTTIPMLKAQNTARNAIHAISGAPPSSLHAGLVDALQIMKSAIKPGDTARSMTRDAALVVAIGKRIRGDLPEDEMGMRHLKHRIDEIVGGDNKAFSRVVEELWNFGRDIADMGGQ